MIFRNEIEQIVNTIIDERLQDIADSLDSAAYSARDHGGSLEHEIAGAFDRIREAIISNIDENWNSGEKAAAAELNRLHEELKR